jgi:hypothetical protein
LGLKWKSSVLTVSHSSLSNPIPFALLKKHLFALAPGEIAETGRVTALLAGCWHEFEGAESQRMHAGKLGRMEDVRLGGAGAEFSDRAARGDGCGLDSRGAPELAR